MDPINIRADYLRAAHYIYFFISIISLTITILSTSLPVTAGFLLAVTISNLFISWLSKKSTDNFYKHKEGQGITNYALLIFIALFIIFAPLYLNIIPFNTMQLWVIIISYFMFFWAFTNYLITRIEVIRDIFRIVHLTKYHVGISRLINIFTNPAYESIVDILDLIEPRLIKFYEPGTDEKVDKLLLMVSDKKNTPHLRRLIIELGIALYAYEITELEKDKTTDNSILIRRFGYKMKMLEIIKS